LEKNIINLLKKISLLFIANELPYMIIGGQAVLYYGNPRLTQDIDITLGFDNSIRKKIIEFFEMNNFKILPKNPDEFILETNVLPVQDIPTKIRVDLIFSFSEYEKIAVNRAIDVIIERVPVKFAAIEDLIIHKLFAGRPRDIEDIEIVIKKNKSKIDVKYIENWLPQFLEIPGKENLIALFNQLMI